MKALIFVLTAWVAGAGIASAQGVPPVPDVTSRADAHFVLGWQNLREPNPFGPYNNWANAIFYGGGGAGWYWNDHLKTQVDFGAGTHATRYGYAPVLANGGGGSQLSRTEIRQDSVALGQHYQFFRNEWFHPHVGVGLEMARETRRERYDPVLVFDSVTRTNREIAPARVEAPEHRILARPFVEAGLKAYMTRRAFFTTDSRFMVRGGIDEVLFRFGFGVDF